MPSRISCLSCRYSATRAIYFSLLTMGCQPGLILPHQQCNHEETRVGAGLVPALETQIKGWTNMVYLRMLYGVLLLRVDCLLKAARYRIFVGRERPDLSSPPWN